VRQLQRDGTQLVRGQTQLLLGSTQGQEGGRVSENNSETFTVPRTDPLYAAFVWRRDSITLARMRPALEEFMSLVATTGCDRTEVGFGSCYEHLDLPLGEWCKLCRYRRVWVLLNLATDPRSSTP
jgi:hypothetical protein